MKKKLPPAIIALCWLLLTRLQSQERSSLQFYQQLYKQAQALFDGIATDSTDSVALSYYTKVAANLQPAASNDTILYNCYERSGLLKQGLGYPSGEILKDYYTALSIQKLYQFDDSVLFRLLLSAGNVHYTEGLFDSSLYYFSRAEKIIDKHPAAGLAGDLYNSLGALYSEAGNYAQSGVYFSKAIELTRQNRPDLKEAIFAMSANIASAVRLSGFPDSALFLYKQLLDNAHPSAAILNNIGNIYLINKQPDSAIYYLQIEHETNGFYEIAIHNAIAQAYMLKGDTIKAADYLQQATALYKENNPQVKSNYYAATEKYLGDLLLLERKALAALPHYQQAIVQYTAKFNDTNAFANPGNFAGDFASYSLFDAITAKAACFAILYNQKKETVYFDAAKSTYDSAFELADYIKKSIDNDEARLFIADKVFDAYRKAVDFLLSANVRRDEKVWTHALEWISKSRATSLAISLKENTIKQYAGLPDSLLQREKNIKVSISRMKLQLQQSPDTANQQSLLSAINTASLQLQSLDNTFKQFPDYYRQKFAANTVDIKNIQKNILDKKTAVICYFKGAEKIYVFIIKHNAILEYNMPSNTILEQKIDTFIRNLTTSNAGKAYDESCAKYLYTHFIQPLVTDLNDITSLIIIPDQHLINIPFEAFRSEANRYLIQDYAITYQYALPFLQKSNAVLNKNNAVAFAPFAYNNPQATMNVLPSSADEIANFPTRSQVIDKAATKSKFMTSASGASVIHLATHAAVNFKEPEDSYIAFYKQNDADTGYKMFAHELYNLQLPHTELVFLSACETGSGKISQSEGALSLSRAFAFAGCPNIITSLWKAEDKTTAYISKKFYNYVSEGYTYAQALQKAKTDLLADGTMSQFHSPAYWSHLIFIGDVQEENSSSWIWITAVGAAVIAALLFIYRRKKNQHIRR